MLEAVFCHKMSGHERNNASLAGHEYRHVYIDKGAKAQLGDTYHFGQFKPKTPGEA
jgi:hypothetical protein